MKVGAFCGTQKCRWPGEQCQLQGNLSSPSRARFPQLYPCGTWSGTSRVLEPPGSWHLPGPGTLPTAVPARWLCRALQGATPSTSSSLGAGTQSGSASPVAAPSPRRVDGQSKLLATSTWGSTSFLGLFIPRKPDPAEARRRAMCYHLPPWYSVLNASSTCLDRNGKLCLGKRVCLAWVCRVA